MHPLAEHQMQDARKVRPNGATLRFARTDPLTAVYGGVWRGSVASFPEKERGR